MTEEQPPFWELEEDRAEMREALFNSLKQGWLTEVLINIPHPLQAPCPAHLVLNREQKAKRMHKEENVRKKKDKFRERRENQNQ